MVAIPDYTRARRCSSAIAQYGLATLQNSVKGHTVTAEELLRRSPHRPDTLALKNPSLVLI